MTICPRTGLAVPECSCPRCHEEQVRRFRPALLRQAPGRRPRPSGGRRGTGDGRLAA